MVVVLVTVIFITSLIRKDKDWKTTTFIYFKFILMYCCMFSVSFAKKIKIDYPKFPLGSLFILI